MFDQFVMWCRTWNPWYLRQSLDAVTELHRTALAMCGSQREQIEGYVERVEELRHGNTKLSVALRDEESRAAALAGKINEQISTIEVLTRKIAESNALIVSFRRLVASYEDDAKKNREYLEASDLENLDWRQRYQDLSRENSRLSCILNSEREYPNTDTLKKPRKVATKKRVIKKKKVIKKIPLYTLSPKSVKR